MEQMMPGLHRRKDRTRIEGMFLLTISILSRDAAEFF